MSLSAAGSEIVCLTSARAEILPLRINSSDSFTAARSFCEVVRVVGAAIDCRGMTGCASALANANVVGDDVASGRGRGIGKSLPLLEAVLGRTGDFCLVASFFAPLDPGFAAGGLIAWTAAVLAGGRLADLAASFVAALGFAASFFAGAFLAAIAACF